MIDGAGIIVIGNEILTGKVRDSNSAYLVQELRLLGVPVLRILVIPDDVETIAQEVRTFSAAFRHVFTSGGVGPTLDDVSLEGIGRAFDLPLYLDPSLEAVIRGHFQERTMESHLKMALIPQGSQLLWSAGFPWPVLMVRNVMVLPGDPGILREKFAGVRDQFRSAPFFLRRVFTTIEEGALSPHLDAVHQMHPETALGSYPVYENAEYRVQVTMESKDQQVVERALRDLLGRLDPGTIVRVV